LAGSDFGIFKIPVYSPQAKNFLKIVGPFVFLLCVCAFLPIWSFTTAGSEQANSETTVDSAPKTSSPNNEAANGEPRFIPGPRTNIQCHHKGVEIGLISIREAKDLLKEYGHYNGEIDDTDDDAFRRAVKSFQDAIGMDPDGCLGPATAAKLKGS
jgi:peptidoglycan hydrolase-like protein with peptidoglycan-binding domain